MEYKCFSSEMTKDKMYERFNNCVQTDFLKHFKALDDDVFIGKLKNDKFDFYYNKAFSNNFNKYYVQGYLEYNGENTQVFWRYKRNPFHFFLLAFIEFSVLLIILNKAFTSEYDISIIAAIVGAFIFCIVLKPSKKELGILEEKLNEIFLY